MRLVEKQNVIHVNLEQSSLKNVKQHALNANVDTQIQKQDLNLKSVHVVNQEIMQQEKVKKNVMNVLLENIQIKNVVKLVIVVLQEQQMILQNNHRVLVAGKGQYNHKDAKQHAVCVI
jgi:hypothetical protein